jgi:hypothetical protein
MRVSCRQVDYREFFAWDENLEQRPAEAPTAAPAAAPAEAVLAVVADVVAPATPATVAPVVDAPTESVERAAGTAEFYGLAQAAGGASWGQQRIRRTFAAAEKRQAKFVVQLNAPPNAHGYVIVDGADVCGQDLHRKDGGPVAAMDDCNAQASCTGFTLAHEDVGWLKKGALPVSGMLPGAHTKL